MKEIWKPVRGYEDIYAVSNLGRWKSTKTVFGNPRNYILRPKLMRDGYLMACLRHNKTKKYVSLHRLIAQAFIPNPQNKSQVNHKDFNKQNNHVNNLEWVTPKENIAHSMAAGVHKLWTTSSDRPAPLLNKLIELGYPVRRGITTAGHPERKMYLRAIKDAKQNGLI